MVGLNVMPFQRLHQKDGGQNFEAWRVGLPELLSVGLTVQVGRLPTVRKVVNG